MNLRLTVFTDDIFPNKTGYCQLSIIWSTGLDVFNVIYFPIFVINHQPQPVFFFKYFSSNINLPLGLTLKFFLKLLAFLHNNKYHTLARKQTHKCINTKRIQRLYLCKYKCAGTNKVTQTKISADVKQKSCNFVSKNANVIDIMNKMNKIKIELLNFIYSDVTRSNISSFFQILLYVLIPTVSSLFFL